MRFRSFGIFCGSERGCFGGFRAGLRCTASGQCVAFFGFESVRFPQSGQNAPDGLRERGSENICTLTRGKLGLVRSRATEAIGPEELQELHPPSDAAPPVAESLGALAFRQSGC